MIRIVLDTNVVVSALLQPLDPSAQIFLSAVSGSIQMCVSGNIYAEYEEVLSTSATERPDDVIQSVLQSIREKAIWVRPTEIVRACSDPDDDVFLECAQAAHANYLVTGNLKHFPSVWAGAQIVMPRWLLDTLMAE
ncbi:MAG TPA: putative toxin-antitoxin system toxin component, PIN family [Bryobacteraceae bacterium]|nr:putative toxin-antitoxin system toxin component, PIN family [Bryobacteraceae bacterium]